MKHLLLLFLLISVSTHASELKPFKTDNCTFWFDGTFRDPSRWQDCCVIHDMFTWAGGSKYDRSVSNLGLKSCIEKKGSPIHAKLIYAGVSAAIYSPIKDRRKTWNNAWVSRSQYGPLTGDEINQLEKEILYGDYPNIKQTIKEEFVLNLRLRN